MHEPMLVHVWHSAQVMVAGAGRYWNPPAGQLYVPQSVAVVVVAITCARAQGSVGWRHIR